MVEEHLGKYKQFYLGRVSTIQIWISSRRQDLEFLLNWWDYFPLPKIRRQHGINWWFELYLKKKLLIKFGRHVRIILLFRKEIVWFSDLQTNLFQDLLAMHGLIVFVILISYESLTNWNLTSTQINWNCWKIPTSLWEYHNPDLDNFDDKYMTHYDLKCGKKQHDIWVNQKRFFLV